MMRTIPRLKRVVAGLVLAAIPSIASAGISYRFETVTTGLAARTMSGEIEVEGAHTRVSIEHGDGAMFADNSFALTTGDGRIVTVVDPASRTYYQIDVDALAGRGGALLGRLQSMFGLQVTGARASARDLGAGSPMEGYSTRRRRVDTACRITAAGAKSPAITFTTSTETWWTDRIPASYATALISRSFRTGVPEVDKLIPDPPAASTGFPLRQVSTTKLVQNGQPIEIRTTTTVHGIRARPIAATRFSLPTGYTKNENPIEKVMKMVE